MSSDVDLFVRGAQADFKAAGHRGACTSDLHTICLQIEDMVQSIALGLNQLTEVLCLMKERVDHIESWIQAQQAIEQEHAAQDRFGPRCFVAR